MAWWNQDRIYREHFPFNETTTVAKWFELRVKQVHFWYWSPGIEAIVYNWMYHNSTPFESLFLSICPKQGIYQQFVRTWFIPFHSNWKYRLDFVISLWQYCPPFHAWYLCDNIHVSSCWYFDICMHCWQLQCGVSSQCSLDVLRLYLSRHHTCSARVHAHNKFCD